MHYCRTKKILIVDGDRLTIRLLRGIFENEGYHVFEASNGKIAIEIIEKIIPSAIILDYTLPDMNGIEVLKLIKSRPEYSNTAVIMLTHNDNEFDTVLCLEIGADDYVLKPFRYRELLARLRSTLKMYDIISNKKNKFISFHDIEIDIESRSVKKGGKAIIMTLKEFDLLVLLASNPQIAFTREMILDKIWGEDANPQSRTIDVHINMLRKKIESENHKFIDTIKGHGYRFRL